MNANCGANQKQQRREMSKPTVLYFGQPDVGIRFEKHRFEVFKKHFNVVVRQENIRADFIAALKSKKYGDFHAIIKPLVEQGTECGRLDEEIIPLLPSSLRIIGCGGAGYDWVDEKLLGERGIIYTNGAGAPDDATSDIALYLIIGTFRLTSMSELGLRAGTVEEFNRVHTEIGALSVNPRGRTLGMIGLGSIAKHIARKGQAIGMRIVYFDPVRLPQAKESELNVTYATFEEVVKSADCLNISVPLLPSTRHLIDENVFAMMKDGARLVNTARGPIVKESALVAALKSGKISSAGIDVHEFEPRVNSELVKMPNVTLTPHIGGVAAETFEGFERLSMENIVAVLVDGKPPLTPVNLRIVEKALAK